MTGRWRPAACRAAIAITFAALVPVVGVADALIFTYTIKPLPVRAPRELVSVGDGTRRGVAPSEKVSGALISYPAFARLQKDATCLQSVAALASFDVPLLIRGIGERKDTSLHEVATTRLVTATYFETLGVTPQAGRFFTEESGGETRGPIAVASYAYWQQRFSGSPSAIGARLLTGESHVTIVGVAASDFAGETPGRAPDLWMEMGSGGPGDRYSRLTDNANTAWMVAIGRLAPRCDRQAAQAQVNRLLHVRLHAASRGIELGANSVSAPGRFGMVLFAIINGAFLLALTPLLMLWRRDVSRAWLSLAWIAGACALTAALSPAVPGDVAQQFGRQLPPDFPATLWTWLLAICAVLAAISALVVRPRPADLGLSPSWIFLQAVLTVFVLVSGNAIATATRGRNVAVPRPDVAVADLVVVGAGRTSEIERSLFRTGGVQALGFASTVLGSPNQRRAPVMLPGARVAYEQASPMVVVVSKELFPGLEVPLISGAYFDDGTAAGDAIVNREFVATHLGRRPAIGAVFTIAAEERRIVGVVDDAGLRLSSLRPAGTVYLPLLDTGATSMTAMYIRTKGPAAPRVHAIDEAIRAATDSDVWVKQLRTLDDARDAEAGAGVLVRRIASVASGVALLVLLICVWWSTSRSLAGRLVLTSLCAGICMGAIGGWWAQVVIIGRVADLPTQAPEFKP